MKVIFQILAVSFFVLLLGAGYAVVTHAAPTFNFSRTILPEIDSTYELGTSTRAWLRINVDELCLTADSCETSWPSGSGNTFTYPLVDTAGTVSLAFGTTTANTWSSLQTFSGNISTAKITNLTGNGIIKTSGGDGTLGIGADGTDYTLINALTCDSGEFFSAATAAGAFTCSAPSGSGITAIGPAGQTQSGATITIATSTDTNVGLTITGSGDTLTFTSTWAGTLADARVADDLTISGGTVNNSPIGASSASTGVFTHATSSSLYVTGLTSALSLFDANGQATEYAGTSCTNQFPRSLSASGSATCATVANTDLANSTVSYGGIQLSLGGSDATPAFALADATGLPIVAGTTGTLSVARGGTGLTTFGGTNHIIYTTAADTLSSEAAFLYDPSVNRITVDHASTTAISGTNATFSGIVDAATGIFTSVLRTVYSATLSLASNGDFGIDSTSNQFQYRSGGATKVLGNGSFYPAFTYATSTAWVGTTTIPIGTAYVGETWNGVQCFTDAGTLNVSFYDGTNRMNLFNASTTVGTVALSTNNTFTAAEKRYVDVGTPASSPTKISCTVNKSITAD